MAHNLDADDDYSSSGDPEERDISPAVFDDTVDVLVPAAPICLRDSATVTDAAQRMLHARQAAVLIVDAAGRLAGIFTERTERIVGGIAAPGAVLHLINPQDRGVHGSASTVATTAQMPLDVLRAMCCLLWISSGARAGTAPRASRSTSRSGRGRTSG